MTDELVAFIRARLAELNPRVQLEVREVLDGIYSVLIALPKWEHQRLYDDADENVGPYPCSRDGDTCECGVLDQQLDILRAFASEWPSHPDYRQEWRP